MRRREWLSGFGLVLGSCGQRMVPVESAPAPEKVHVARPKATAAPAADGPAPERDGFAEVDWRMLRGLDTRTGQASPLLEMIAGTNVKIAGYMVPLDDGFEEANEFLLVPTAGACVHTPPPPGNQIVYATMSTGRPAKVELVFSVWACGKLDIATTESPYGAVGFKLGVLEMRRRG